MRGSLATQGWAWERAQPKQVLTIKAVTNSVSVPFKLWRRESVSVHLVITKPLTVVTPDLSSSHYPFARLLQNPHTHSLLIILLNTRCVTSRQYQAEFRLLHSSVNTVCLSKVGEAGGRLGARKKDSPPSVNGTASQIELAITGGSGIHGTLRNTAITAQAPIGRRLP